MNRKAALVGCREGQWIRTHMMQPLRLRSKVRAETIVQALLIDSTGVEKIQVFTGPGVYQLESASWAKLTVCDGPHEDALCLLESAD